MCDGTSSPAGCAARAAARRAGRGDSVAHDRCELVAVDEHEIAAIELNRPSARRLRDTLAPDLDAVAGAVPKILDHPAAPFRARSRINPHGRVNRIRRIAVAHRPYPHLQLKLGARFEYSRLWLRCSHDSATKLPQAQHDEADRQGLTGC